MATIKITLHEVVKTEKEIDITFPFYIKDKNGIDFIVYLNEDKYIKTSTSINSVFELVYPQLQEYLQKGWKQCPKKEFNEALEKVSKNIDSLYEKVLDAQANAIHKDECDQRADFEDAKGQEQLENYLNK